MTRTINFYLVSAMAVASFMAFEPSAASGDTVVPVCHENNLSWPGFAALQPVKSQGSGNFNCQGSYTFFNEVTGAVAGSIPLTNIAISSLWDNVNGRLVTYSALPGAPVSQTFEYGVKQGVSC